MKAIAANSISRSAYDEHRTLEIYRARNRGARKIFYSALETSVLKNMNLADRVALDVGTGVAQKALVLSPRCRFVIASDVSELMLSGAKLECDGVTNLVLVRHDALALPFRSGVFDLVTCYGLFEGVDNMMPFLREFRRVLRCDGLLLFTCANAEAWHRSPSPGIQKVLYRADDVNRFIENAGYSVIVHKTIFYLESSWLSGLFRLFGLVAADRNLVRLVVNVEGALSGSLRWAWRGQTHLVMAQLATSAFGV